MNLSSKSPSESAQHSLVTLSEEQAVEHTLSRIAERFSAREPSVQERAKMIRDNLKHDFPRLADQDGVLVQCEDGVLEKIVTTSLELASQYTGYEFKNDPGATSIKNHDLVLISLNEALAEKDSKKYVQRLENQLKAIMNSGAVALIVIPCVFSWKHQVWVKVQHALDKYKGPRILITTQSKEGNEVHPATASMLPVALGEENILLN